MSFIGISRELKDEARGFVGKLFMFYRGSARPWRADQKKA